MNPLTFRSLVEYEQHRVVCYDYIAPKVVFTQQFDEEASGRGPGLGGRRGAGPTRSDSKKTPS